MNNPFPSDYEKFIFVSRYARWLEAEGRRENWDETVDRLIKYYMSRVSVDDDDLPGHPQDWKDLYETIYNLEVMPSMRALMAAGLALDRCDVAAYNCAYLTCDTPRAFDEAMYILMCGTGVGFSVEKKYVDKLPAIAEIFEETNDTATIVVGDSKEGWAKAYRQLVSGLYAGDVFRWDVRGVRPAGARLKTFGGRASGPGPLEDLFRFTIQTFKRAAGRRLTTLECHDLMCKIADIVVVGGVRRSAMISLSDVTDDRMRVAKSGEWWNANGYRRLANNSAVYENRRPDMDLFFKEWMSLYESRSGERGIFNRAASQRIARRSERRKSEVDFGTNPCSEIILRPSQFCNLTEVVVRATDGMDDLRKKCKIASILGTIQSSFTNFRYLRKLWTTNCEEERLLGVSLTGVCDNLELLTKENLCELRQIVVDTNVEWSQRLGIAASCAVTCVKPSGTVSQLVGSASGCHPRHSPYYIRTVRGDNKDPLTQFLISQGVPAEQDYMNSGNTVFSFPHKSPEHSVTRDNLTAIEHLEIWKNLQEYWCEHKPSVTINVKDDEWFKVGAWVYENFDTCSGVSFLPFDGGTYRQAPYQEINEAEYNEAVARMPKIDWEKLREFEFEDNTTGSQELACSGGVCEVVSIGQIDG